MDRFAPPRLPRIVPPETRPSGLRFIRAMLRNPIEAISRAVYERPFVQAQGRFGATTTFICDPDLVRRIMVEHADSFTRTKAFLRALSPALGDAILTSDGTRWRSQRRIAAPVFRHDRIKSFVPEMLAAARDTRCRLKELAAGTEIGLAHEMMQTTFAIIADTMLSGRSGLDTDRIERSITHYLENLRWQVVYALIGIGERMPYPGRRKLRDANRFMRGEIFRIVGERRAAIASRDRAEADLAPPDLMDQLIAAEDPEGDGRLSDRDVADNILTFVAAGHETTALALTWALYLLAKHPHEEARVLAEIADVTGGGEMLPEHVERLVYTRQVVNETLRLYPPAALIPRTAAVAVDLGVVRIPAGSAVLIPVYAMHRHRMLWANPDAFEPDNFAPDAVAARHRYAFIPFGAGPRICIGMGFAMTEAVAILAVLLPALRMTPIDERNLGLRHSITLRPTNGMPMTVHRRM